MGKYSGAKKGIYKPLNPKKWVVEGAIIHRSMLEKRWFTFFDLNKDVVLVASEKIIVPYFDPVTQKNRRYITDIIIKFNSANGSEKVKLIEIKCHAETVRPKQPKRITKAYTSSVLTFLTNQAKWEAARSFAAKRGWDFVVLTERDL